MTGSTADGPPTDPARDIAPGVPMPEPPREIAPGVHWLGGCFQIAPDGVPMHFHVSTYLVSGSERTLLYDTGDPAHWPVILPHLEALLGDRGLDYVVPSHPELPHAGNLSSLLVRWPNAQVHGDMRDVALYVPEHADRLVHRDVGDVIDLGDGRTFEFVRAHIRDLPNSMWGHDNHGGVLFVSDGFSYLHGPDPLTTPEGEPAHAPGQCRLTSEEILDGPTVGQAAYGTGRALYWTRFVDVGGILDDIEAMLAARHIAAIAPCHGAVITDLDDILQVFRQAHEEVYEG